MVILHSGKTAEDTHGKRSVFWWFLPLVIAGRWLRTWSLMIIQTWIYCNQIFYVALCYSWKICSGVLTQMVGELWIRTFLQIWTSLSHSHMPMSFLCLGLKIWFALRSCWPVSSSAANRTFFEESSYLSVFNFSSFSDAFHCHSCYIIQWPNFSDFVRNPRNWVPMKKNKNFDKIGSVESDILFSKLQLVDKNYFLFINSEFNGKNMYHVYQIKAYYVNSKHSALCLRSF